MYDTTKILENATVGIYVENEDGSKNTTHELTRAQLPTTGPLTMDAQFVSEDVQAANLGAGNIAVLRSENIGLRQHMVEISLPTVIKSGGVKEDSLQWLERVTESRENLILEMQYHEISDSNPEVLVTYTLQTGGVIKNVNFSDAGLEGGCSFTFCGFKLTII